MRERIGFKRQKEIDESEEEGTRKNQKSKRNLRRKKRN